MEPKFKALDQSRLQENDLNFIVQILKFYKEIETLNERTQKGSEKVAEVEAQREIIQKKITELSKNIEVLKSQKLDASLLSDGKLVYSTEELQKITAGTT